MENEALRDVVGLGVLLIVIGAAQFWERAAGRVTGSLVLGRG